MKSNNRNKPNGDFKKKNTKSNFSKPKPKTPKTSEKIDDGTIRLNKYIANSGACSRREADVYIQSGNVKVNGNVITELGYKVLLTDEVIFDGATISPEKKVYVLLNKPKNFTTSTDNSTENRNVFELIKPATTTGLKPVGRMDKNTMGLLLFTNDNDLLVKFNQPSQKSFKIYQVTLDKNLKFEDLEKISNGVTIEEHKIFIDEVSYIESLPKNEIGIKLRTANVKVVRAIFEKYNYNVLKVDRVSFAGLTKKNLPRGHWRYLTSQEVVNLKNI